MTISKAKDDNLNVKLSKIISDIKSADIAQVESQLEIARLLTAVKKYKLYTPEFSDFKIMVQATLDFAPSAAEKYVSFYTHYEALKYGREEILKLMRQLGWRKVQFCLRGAKKKMGYRAMKNYLEEHYYAQDRQFNFNMLSDKSAQRLEKALKQHGLEISKGGRRAHMTESMESLLVDYEALKKHAAKLPGKRKKLALAS